MDKKQYNVFIKKMPCELCFRVEANNEKEAIRKVEENGFNCGVGLGGDYFGNFKVRSILPVSKVSFIDMKESLSRIESIFIMDILRAIRENCKKNPFRYCKNTLTDLEYRRILAKLKITIGDVLHGK